MKSTQAIGALLFFTIFFGGLYFMWNSGNIAFFLVKTAKVNAQIDSIKVVVGFAGQGYNQKIYYHYTYNDNKYLSSFRNDATMWKPLVNKDSLQLRIALNKPNNNKVIGVYYSYR